MRRWPLLALVLLVAIPVAASTMDAMRLGLVLLVLFYAAAGIEVCFVAATRPRRISLTAALIVLAVRPSSWPRGSSCRNSSRWSWC